jgi:hypothetical protein
LQNTASLPPLSAQLGHAETRINTIDEMLKPKAKAQSASISPEQIREFLMRKMEQLVEVLLGDPERAKQELSKRIDKLVLTPELRDGRNVFTVTGDLRLFADDDVMPLNSGALATSKMILPWNRLQPNPSVSSTMGFLCESSPAQNCNASRHRVFVEDGIR